MGGLRSDLESEAVRVVLWYGGFLGVVGIYRAAAGLLGLQPRPELGAGGIGNTVLVGLLLVVYLVTTFHWTAVRHARSFSELTTRLRERLVTWTMIERLLGAFVLLWGVEQTLYIHAAFKGAIPVLGGYRWDLPLARLDAFLHGGRDPWRWLHALPARDTLTLFLDRIYFGWYGVMATGLMVAAFWPPLRWRIRFFSGFVALWILGGGLLANLFGSGGPVYFAAFTGGERFSPLVGYLNGLGTEASRLQGALWEAYTGRRAMMFDGISAMPSLHVGVAVYFAASVYRVRWAFAAAVVWCLLIFLGSVDLGWHYAVDGYVAAALAVGVWWATGRGDALGMVNDTVVQADSATDEPS